MEKSVVIYIPRTDEILLLLFYGRDSHLIGAESHEIGSMSPALVKAFGWKVIGEL